MKHAHETIEHLQLKGQLANLLRRCGWIVLVEALCVDLAAFHVGLGLLWVLEVERSEKWVRRNMEKAFERGADRFLVVANSTRIAAKAWSIVARMSVEMRRRTLVATVDQVNENFVRTIMERG